MKLQGTAALVTGAARGIGKAVSLLLLQHGVKVCIADVDEAEGRETLDEARRQFGRDNVIFRKCDVTSDDCFEEAIVETKGAFGRLDILINNAGVSDDDDWALAIDINLKGVIRGTYLAFRHLADGDGKKGGVVINMASITGLRPSSVAPVYSSSKFGVVGFTRSIGDVGHVKKTGVKVNVICPKGVDTRMMQDAMKVKIFDKNHEETVKTIAESLMPPTAVARGFVKILEDDVSAAVLVVESNESAFYHTFASEDNL